MVAKVAAIEVPRGEWPELIGALLANMSAQPPASALRQATLEALGYTCEELGALEEDYLEQEQVNAILTAVVQVGAACAGVGCWVGWGAGWGGARSACWGALLRF